MSYRIVSLNDREEKLKNHAVYLYRVSTENALLQMRPMMMSLLRLGRNFEKVNPELDRFFPPFLPAMAA